MGWLYTHRSKEALIAERLAPTSSFTRDRTVLAHHLVGNELWTVVQWKMRVAQFIEGNAIGDAITFINLDLLDGNQGYWGYKAIPEEMGPYYYGCPLHFLDMATYGIDPAWREALRRHHGDTAA